MSRLLSFLVIAACTAQQATSEGLIYEDEEWGIRFSYPERFVVGQFDKSLYEDFPDLADLIVDSFMLVEPAQLTWVGASADSLVPGEVDGIVLTKSEGTVEELTEMIGQLGEWKTSIGGTSAYRFPSFVGKWGDALFYYVVPLTDRWSLDIIAQKQYSRGKPRETHYDEVIEKIIATLEVTTR